ncbi:hypothetical protein [uncultured Maribacter sp.]|uniref:hypothetical protein n=1 Tax=uncultured Maribacter sp. TaxID=431308 RepID=UPI00260F69F1|nr:hypothetical protein [uncultured Maribacter sp.]
MKKLSLLAFVLGLLISCQKDSENKNIDESGELPISNASGYDKSLIPEKQPLSENLLLNGSFEEDNSLWVTCGTTEILDSNEAYDGNTILELESDGTCENYNSLVGTLNGNAYYPLEFQTIPDNVYISFYVKSSVPINLNFENIFNFSLMGNEDIYNYFGKRNATFVNIYENAIGQDWTKIKMSLDKETIENAMQGETPKWLLLEMATYYEIKLSFDDIRITLEEDTIQADVMPTGITKEQILVTNLDKNIPATLNLDGSNFVNYTDISTENITSIPFWYDNSSITIAEKTFNPLPSPDPTVIPASQSELYKYDLKSGDKEFIYETLGNPGKYVGFQNASNSDALDVEVKRCFWNKDRNQGALTVCANNRGNVYVSDDVCFIYIIDSDGNRIGEGFNGFNAVWSSTGRLAYVYKNVMYVSDISGTTITHDEVHRSYAGIRDVVDWSPDGSKLVFLENGGASVYINETSDWATNVVVLDLNTNKTSNIALLDHGFVYPNISWSKDGKYMVYSLRLKNNKIQVWWLEVATGKTGPVTNTFNAYGANFKK